MFEKDDIAMSAREVTQSLISAASQNVTCKACAKTRRVKKNAARRGSVAGAVDGVVVFSVARAAARPGLKAKKRSWLRRKDNRMRWIQALLDREVDGLSRSMAISHAPRRVIQRKHDPGCLDPEKEVVGRKIAQDPAARASPKASAW